MGKLIDDIEHLELDIKNLSKTGLKHSLNLSDIKEHLKDQDAHLHDLLNHVTHIEKQIEE